MLDLEAIKTRRAGVVAILGPEPWAIERGETEEQDEHGDTTGDTLPIALIGPTGASYEGPSPVLQLVGFHDWFDAVAEFHAHAPKDVDALVAEVERLRAALVQVWDQTHLRLEDAHAQAERVWRIADAALSAKQTP